jgi:putative ABC transport system permease protein
MKNEKHYPPQLFLRFFRWFCRRDLQPSIEGDLMELYEKRREQGGKRRADLAFMKDVLLLLRPSMIRRQHQYQSFNQYGMLKNYFKIGWRNLWRNKGYSAINIGGLALGMTVAMLIGLWIQDEWTFNTYHGNYQRIAQVYRNGPGNNDKIETNGVMPTGLGTELGEKYDAQFSKVVLIRSRLEDRVLSVGDRKFSQNGYFMQPAGAEMFGLRMKAGIQNGLADLKSILLSESLARKIFGDADPINQLVTMDAKWELKVTGIYEDLPKNSTFAEASYFAPLDLFLEGWASLNVWDNYNMNLYVQLNEGQTFEGASAAIKDVIRTHAGRSGPENIFLLPMVDWHLRAQFEDGKAVTSDRMKLIWLYCFIACFVLILACINFMNLSTARSEKRAKEVGIRKSIGSHRRQLVMQFFGESLLIASLALVMSLLLVTLTLPWFNQVADKAMAMPWTHYKFWLSTVGFALVTGLLAGSYPALYLSSFDPVRVLKGSFKAGRAASIPRRIMVVVQFTVSITLIIGTVAVYNQIQFTKNRPVGYTREGLVEIHLRSPEAMGRYTPLQNELKKTGTVLEIAEGSHSVNSQRGWNGGFTWQGRNNETTDLSFNINHVTYEYGKTLGWKFVEGRDFSRAFASDVSGLVINETAARLMGFEHATGEVLMAPANNGMVPVTILGVISDVIKGSPYEPADPCMYFLSEADQSWLFIRIDPRVSTHEALPKIEAVFKALMPSVLFDYKFADEEYSAKFRAEERIGTLATVFSSLAIFISCCGLLGLVSFVAAQRTKEIGIRKVMGASVLNVWRLLSSEFLILVFISSSVAIPIASWLMTRWLKQFAYHTTPGWHIYALAALGALLITLLTVSIQTIKAANANPVRSLRSE